MASLSYPLVQDQRKLAYRTLLHHSRPDNLAFCRNVWWCLCILRWRRISTGSNRRRDNLSRPPHQDSLGSHHIWGHLAINRQVWSLFTKPIWSLFHNYSSTVSWDLSCTNPARGGTKVEIMLSASKKPPLTGLYWDKRNARSLPGVINDNAKAKLLYHLYCAFSELLCIVHMLRKLYTKNTE